MGRVVKFLLLAYTSSISFVAQEGLLHRLIWSNTVVTNDTYTQPCRTKVPKCTRHRTSLPMICERLLTRRNTLTYALSLARTGKRSMHTRLSSLLGVRSSVQFSQSKQSPQRKVVHVAGRTQQCCWCCQMYGLRYF